MRTHRKQNKTKKKTGHQITDNPLKPHTTTINTLVDEIRSIPVEIIIIFKTGCLRYNLKKPDFLVD